MLQIVFFKILLVVIKFFRVTLRKVRLVLRTVRGLNRLLVEVIVDIECFLHRQDDESHLGNLSKKYIIELNK